MSFEVRRRRDWDRIWTRIVFRLHQFHHSRSDGSVDLSVGCREEYARSFHAISPAVVTTMETRGGEFLEQSQWTALLATGRSSTTIILLLLVECSGSTSNEFISADRYGDIGHGRRIRHCCSLSDSSEPTQVWCDDSTWSEKHRSSLEMFTSNHLISSSLPSRLSFSQIKSVWSMSSMPRCQLWSRKSLRTLLCKKR